MVERVGKSKLLNFASIYEQGTIDQALQTASMPFVHPHVALMPDAHVGMGSAVGTVIPTLDAVIPAAVGVDIGCGMIAVQTRLTEKDLFRVSMHHLRIELQRNIPMGGQGGAGYNVYNEEYSVRSHTSIRISALQQLAEKDDVDLSHSLQWREQLGSLGGGNHFIELCLDQYGAVWMFLHSGSRGVGNKIAQKHIKIAQRLCKMWHIQLPDGNQDLAYLPQGVPEFSRYIKDLNWAQKFALYNREDMMDRFATALSKAAFGEDDRESLELERINCHHNYTQKENHGGKDVWLTRKGAINASEGVRGLIPGSMGTRSYVVVGKGNAAGLRSAPHGAGRVMSRTQAKAHFTVSDMQKAMAGIEYRNEIAEDLIDEIPGAYKPIDQVILDAGSLVRVTHTLTQILNAKGTK